MALPRFQGDAGGREDGTAEGDTVNPKPIPEGLGRLPGHGRFVLGEGVVSWGVSAWGGEAGVAGVGSVAGVSGSGSGSWEGGSTVGDAEAVGSAAAGSAVGAEG